MITLPAHCSTIMAQSLLAALIDHADRGADIVIDGAGVDNVGQAVLQVLVCGKAHADATGRSFTISDPSAQLIQRATLCRLDRLLGLGADDNRKARAS